MTRAGGLTYARAVKLKQCKACPWRVSTVPDRDIPNGYDAELHKRLKCTLAAPGAPPGSGPLRAFACHETKTGAELMCAGWMHHQLGSGNNLSLRLLALQGQLPKYEVSGEQHERFEDTLPKA